MPTRCSQSYESLQKLAQRQNIASTDAYCVAMCAEPCKARRDQPAALKLMHAATKRAALTVALRAPGLAIMAQWASSTKQASAACRLLGRALGARAVANRMEERHTALPAVAIVTQ